MGDKAIPAGETRLIEPRFWQYHGREVTVVAKDTAGFYVVRAQDGRELRLHRRDLIRATPEGRRYVEALATLQRLEDEIEAETDAVRAKAIAKRKPEMAKAHEAAVALGRMVTER